MSSENSKMRLLWVLALPALSIACFAFRGSSCTGRLAAGMLLASVLPLVSVETALAGRPRTLPGRMASLAEHKPTAEVLRQSQKMEEVGLLAGGVAHDFNNLLTVIGGHADLLLASLDPRDPRRAGVEEIKKAGERAASLTRQLLTLSRRRPLSREALDLGSVVGNLKGMLQRLIGEHIELQALSRPGLSPVLGDLGQIEQVILNLVINAGDAMPEGGRLIIETAECEISDPESGSPVPSGEYVTLTVSDSGCGMGADIQRRIFEPFFTTKEPGKGTGLGLATVREIVRESAGFIEVRSALGRGTAVAIYFPMAELAPAARPARPAPASLRRGSETIMVVEDEETVRTMARLLLNACGYHVLEAASGEEALRFAERHAGAIDLLLADVVMPGINGHKLAGLMASFRPELKILYMSGYTREAILQHAVPDPEISYLQKPFTPQVLALSVRRVLDGEPEPPLNQSVLNRPM